MEFGSNAVRRSPADTAAYLNRCFFGIILGTIFGIMRLSKTPLRYLAAAYIDFIRGTPLLVQIFIIYYGVPTIIKQAVPLCCCGDCS